MKPSTLNSTAALPAFKATSLISIILLTVTACAQSTPNTTGATGQTSSQIQMAQSESVERKAYATSVSPAVDSRLREVLKQAGIKPEITAIKPSNFPNMYQVDIAGQLPLHMTEDGKYVVQGELQKNPKSSKRLLSQTPTSISSDLVGQPLDANAKNPFYYTAVPGVIWGATLDGIPYLVSADGQYITDGEIAVIENGQFMGLDEDFEARKNRSVFDDLDESQLIIYPATSAEKAVLYVATDVNCPYCRRLHQQLPMLNQKGVTVKMIGYPIYENSPEQMRGIWCQTDKDSRRKALDKAMLAGEMTPAAANCNTDYVTPNRDRSAGLAVIATPSIYREDGVLYQASFEHPEFLEFLGIE